MKNTDLKALIKAQRTVEKLKKKMQRNLSKLPAKYGYGSVAELIAALQEIDGGATSSVGGKKRGRPVGSGKGKRKKRTEITDEIRARVKSMLEVPEPKSVAEIAASVGISTGSVNLLKKRFGLVTPRSKK